MKLQLVTLDAPLVEGLSLLTLMDRWVIHFVAREKPRRRPANVTDLMLVRAWMGALQLERAGAAFSELLGLSDGFLSSTSEATVDLKLLVWLAHGRDPSKFVADGRSRGFKDWLLGRPDPARRSLRAMADVAANTCRAVTKPDSEDVLDRTEGVRKLGELAWTRGLAWARHKVDGQSIVPDSYRPYFFGCPALREPSGAIVGPG